MLPCNKYVTGFSVIIDVNYGYDRKCKDLFAPRKSRRYLQCKYVVYHKGERKFFDSPRLVSKRQITKDFQIKDKMTLKWLDETLDDFRLLIGTICYRVNFFTCEQLRDYLRDSSKDIDIIEFANEHIDSLKSEQQNREPYSGTFRNTGIA